MCNFLERPDFSDELMFISNTGTATVILDGRGILPVEFMDPRDNSYCNDVL